MLQVEAKIVKHVNVGPDYYLLELTAPEIACQAQPGQFVHVKCQEGKDPLLRRPFSFYGIDRDKGIIKILYEVRGYGTDLLSKQPEGYRLDIMGPLGNGFCIGTSNNTAVLIGGGIGSAPMAALARRLPEYGFKSTIVLLGAPIKEKIIPFEEFETAGAEIKTATDDGSMGHKGFVSDLLPSVLQGTDKKAEVFACGPFKMLKAVSEACNKYGVSCQVSLDEIMACGVGACQGCACKVYRNDEEVYERACTEGPIFDSREVVWD